MKTGVIQIGNSDDKLSQTDWAQFILDITLIVSRYRIHQHFNGFSAAESPWQNACWVIDIPDDRHLEMLHVEMGTIAQKYKQKSIALTVGDTEFISGIGD